MARTILGVNAVVFDSTGITAGTFAKWTAALPVVTLVHNLGAFLPGTVGYDAEHALKITVQQLTGYAGANLNAYPTWVSSDRNTIVGTAQLDANAIRDGVIYVEKLHSVTR